MGGIYGWGVVRVGGRGGVGKRNGSRRALG